MPSRCRRDYFGSRSRGHLHSRRVLHTRYDLHRRGPGPTASPRRVGGVHSSARNKSREYFTPRNENQSSLNAGEEGSGTGEGVLVQARRVLVQVAWIPPSCPSLRADTPLPACGEGAMTAPNTLEEATLLASRCLWLNPPPIGGRNLLLPTDREVVIARPTQP